MHDVISKTLPADPLRVELDRMAAKWTPGACSEAGELLFGNTSGEWTLESLAKVDAHLQTVAAMRQDTAMLERDELKAVPASAAEDHLAGVRAALAPLMDFGAGFEASRAKAEAVLDEVRKLLLADRMAFIASVQKPTKPPVAPENGLLTFHNPDRRVL